MGVDKEITVAEMLATIARAHMAEGQQDAKGIVDQVRHLAPKNLIAEFHWAVAVLNQKGLLSRDEWHRVSTYAQDHFDVPMAP